MEQKERERQEGEEMGERREEEEDHEEDEQQALERELAARDVHLGVVGEAHVAEGLAHDAVREHDVVHQQLLLLAHRAQPVADGGLAVRDDEVELRLELLHAEVRELTSAIQQLVATTPQRTKTWLEPREIAPMLGISVRTLAVWRTNGRFRPISVRKQGSGYQFHADWALADAQEVSR